MSDANFEAYLRWRWALAEPMLELDLGLAGMTDDQMAELAEPMDRAMAAMARLEAGGIANPDEDRMVGHYWLRSPGLAPTPEIEEEIVGAAARIEEFATRVRSGQLTPPEGGTFRRVVLAGIGGSALGPMLLADAAERVDDGLALHVFDNTDPDGIERALANLGSLHDVLFLVISKSGGTAETRNGMLELMAACEGQGIAFSGHAVAVTTAGSRLDQTAERDGWVGSFPLWDWVGGRTSITAAVGLLPAALLGMDIRAFLGGAAAMDEATRARKPDRNPALLMAAFWYLQGRGRGDRAMVVLPYRDRLGLLGRYLQQLVMESLGKELDRTGTPVHQGLAVYGNKGSTDQHAFVQQLREGRHDFFALFVRVLTDRKGSGPMVEDDVTTGDYLDGFWQGTRQALAENGRRSATLTLQRLDDATLGAILALFERTVGLYAEMIDVNAYHQPGVEAGKKAAASVLECQGRILANLDETPRSATRIAHELDMDPVVAWEVLRHLAVNRSDVVATSLLEPESARFVRG